MKSLFIDCPTGIAGDMLLSALLDIGIPKRVIEEPLLSIGLGKTFSLGIQEARSFGIRGLRTCVEGLPVAPSSTRLKKIIEIVEQASWSNPLKNKVLNVFMTLGAAEASVHGTALEDIHLHEVGSLDALIEVVSICAAVEYLNPLEICCSPLPTGSGSVSTSHGLLPVPVPVVVELAKTNQIKLVTGEEYPKGELTTPTGLALMVVLADRYCQPNSFEIEAVGIGLGKRNFDRPNLLRAYLLDQIERPRILSESNGLTWQTLFFQEAWIDDASPEDIAHLINELRKAGAIDVVSQPVQMKKGRQGVCIKAIVTSNDIDAVRLVWFLKSTTIGLRENLGGRWVLSRRRGTCLTAFGKIEVKQVRRPDGCLTIKPEHDEIVRISLETGKSLEDVRSQVIRTYEDFVPSEDWS
ncbi:nickel pincer cofactor biosynthesis protein LarC [Prochlorococcus sp. MIT 1307]|uniref:nickel pincer cofactor biosynthesis protein LarC n=1 Tax=Prochlorococcus sp. MIT 1307 TaxID=3096219 RepID=UPI002A75631F|nr:nickel pincer cofactor biosynthesis protein LarC [Prochlorococcus sp. MIT 1307]